MMMPARALLLLDLTPETSQCTLLADYYVDQYCFYNTMQYNAGRQPSTLFISSSG